MRACGNGGVVIFGQPGIGMSHALFFDAQPLNLPSSGKTGFLYYVLFQRLSEGLPTAIQLYPQKIVVVFTQHGSHIQSIDWGLRTEENMWALTDSGDTVERPCDGFLNPTISDLFVAQVTSPKQARGKEWIKQRQGRLFWMEPISATELKAFG
jgi:hypothetical protein